MPGSLNCPMTFLYSAKMLFELVESIISTPMKLH
jgi:hypothetical protein